MSVSECINQAGTSSELTGGAGYTYEDAVVAYYLTALLREENAAGQTGCVTRVAVQQGAQGEPLDDVIIDTSIGDAVRRLACRSNEVSPSALPRVILISGGSYSARSNHVQKPTSEQAMIGTGSLSNMSPRPGSGA